MLDVREMTKTFGAEPVFADVSLTLGPGAALAVVGPNGAGKSTFLRCVLGWESRDAGEVLLDGRPLDERDPAVRAGIAVSIDEMSVFPDLSVAEHLDLLACAHGVPDTSAVVEATLAEVGLTEAGDQLPVTLSSGQRRRLALASWLVRPRRLLILDEPEQRLDTAGWAWLAQRLVAEKGAGTAILFACHDDDLVDHVADTRLRLGR